MNEASVRMVSFLGSLDSQEFRARRWDVAQGTINIALKNGWVEEQKVDPSEPASMVQYRLTPRGEKAREHYLR